MDWFPFLLSLKVALLATAITAAAGGALAYWLAMSRFKGRAAVEALVTLPLVLPPTVTGYYLVMLFGRNGFIGAGLYALTGRTIMFTWWAAVLASAVVALPLMVKTSQAAIEGVDREMIDSAYMLGYSRFETALRVIFPLAARGLAAGIILSFARAIGEFGATLMLAGNIPGRTNTMPLAIYSLAASGEWGKAQAMVLALTLSSFVFLYIANRFVGGRRK
jgi:molybdate transport system permease protein